MRPPSSEYIEVLLGRSLEDDTSIPISYPRTLVAAIKLAIGALKERAAGSPCAAIAHDVILFSVFTLSRQIPLHMLLASVALEPKEASQLGRKGPLVWNDTKLPLGEIQRELERNSLVKRDEPLSLCPAHGGGEGLGSAAATIAVNEIVQRVIREDIERSGEIDGVLFRFAYHVQSWVSFLYDSGGLHCGHDFIPHAFAVADYALQHDVANMSVALLWGNSANILRVNERFEEAERYLAAELEFLTSIRTDPLVEIQTAVALADTLMRRNDTVATATESALELVGRATALISTADLDDPEPLVEEVWAARGLLAHIRRTQRYDAECQHLQTALEAYTEMLSSLGKKSVNASVLEISEHILSHEPEVAKIKAMALLEDSSVLQRHHPQLFRFVATACAQLHEWVETVQYMRMFSSLIRSKEFHYQDLTSLAIDVGIEGIGAILDGDVEAVAVLRSLLRLVDQYELYLRPLHNADAACVLVLYALREVTKNTLDLRDQYLTQVDFSDLRAESPERARSWEALAQLVSSVRVAKPVTDATLDGLPISSHDVDEVQREPLIKSEPWSGPTYDEQRGTVTVGTNPRGDELLWHVHSADGRRVEGGVIVGPAGSGKTNALRLIARELAHLREIVIWFADPSGRHMESLTSMPCVDWAAFDPNEARNVIIGAAAAAKSRLEENVPYLEAYS